jgi:hypothetical protein
MTDPIDRKSQSCRSYEAEGSTSSSTTTEDGAATKKKREMSEVPVETLSSSANDYSQIALPVKKPTNQNTNAARTAARDASSGAYADAGITEDGKAAYASAALVKGRGPGGAEVEIMSVSAQAGESGAEVTGAVAHVALISEYGSLGVDALAVRGSFGTHNVDGSEGMHVAGTAVLVGAEGTSQMSIGGTNVSFTGGLSVGVGLEASIGARKGHDGHGDEVCIRGAGGPVTLGLCVEAPVVAAAVRAVTTTLY